MIDSPKEHLKIKGGKGKLKGNVSGKGFDVLGQPSPEKKKEGWEKKRKGMELLKFILDQKFKGAEDGKLKRSIANYYNCGEDDITVEMMMNLRQVEKAISKSDTQAFKVVTERIYGLPKDVKEITLNKPIIIDWSDDHTANPEAEAGVENSKE